MSKRPENVDGRHEHVMVKAALTHYWFQGVRHPVLYMLDDDGEPDYAKGHEVATDGDLNVADDRLVPGAFDQLRGMVARAEDQAAYWMDRALEAERASTHKGER